MGILWWRNKKKPLPPKPSKPDPSQAETEHSVRFGAWEKEVKEEQPKIEEKLEEEPTDKFDKGSISPFDEVPLTDDLFISTYQIRENFKNVFAGTVASVVSIAVAQPFYVLKRIYQLDYDIPSKKISHIDRGVFELPTSNPSIKHVILTLYKKQGIKGFWKNHTTMQSVSLVQNILLFWSFEYTRPLFDYLPFEENYTSLYDFGAGFISGFWIAFLGHPVEAIHTMQMKRAKALKRFDAKFLPPEVYIFRRKSIYFGILPTLLHTTLLYGCKFWLYNHICGLLFSQASEEKRTILHLKLLAAAAATGMLSDALFYPLDFVKRRLTVLGLYRQLSAYDDTCRTLLQCFSTVIRNQGILALYRGVISSVLHSGVATAVQFSLFDNMRRWADQVFEFEVV